MSTVQKNMSLAGQPPVALSLAQKGATILGVFGLLVMALAAFNVNFPNKALWLTISLVSLGVGIVWFGIDQYKNTMPGIKNDGVWFKSISSRGFWAWVAGLVLTGFYIVLYFYAELLGQGSGGAANTGLIGLFDPLSNFLKGAPASQWFVYGVLYTIAILSFGIKFIYKYRHNNYEKIRTISVMFFQTIFAFLIPEIMARLNGDMPYYDLKNVWPLNYYLFDQWNVDGLLINGSLGLTFLIWGIVSILVITPILTFRYGKRWYCSWVCGCGGLAETAGDSFRHLSDKSKTAWKVERWVVHSVLVFAVVTTTGVIHSYLGDGSQYWFSKDVFLIAVGALLTIIFALIWKYKKHELKKDARYGAIGYLAIILALIGLHFATGSGNLFIFESNGVRTVYGFLIGSIFSGVIGTGFYPIFGNRVWCRMGCPMAAILGLQQRLFSKFRITTNGGQCISCGNCSTYCEMGIDVRAYAQKGENIVRASCVGCGVCSAVCPRGVLKLENGDTNNRINPTDILLGNDVDLMDLVNQK
ncbi:MAG: 4Fe-4S dicluster domain-containing protein [Gilvibacter sp.]